MLLRSKERPRTAPKKLGENDSRPTMPRGEQSFSLIVTWSTIGSATFGLPEGSASLRNAHTNLQNIRRVLARPEFRPH
jgi:hypothetical protein